MRNGPIAEKLQCQRFIVHVNELLRFLANVINCHCTSILEVL